jgi:flagellar hook-length control protein FliK
MMQRIATSQSDVATLPVNIVGNEASSGQANNDFRDMLESHKQPRPEVAKPVDPISAKTERATSGKTEAIKDTAQASPDDTDTNNEKHISGKDRQSTEQHVADKGFDAANSRDVSKQNSVNKEDQKKVSNGSTDVENKGDVVDYTDNDAQQVALEAEQSTEQLDAERLDSDKSKKIANNHQDPIEIDWLTLLNNIEYAKLNDLKSAHGQENVDLAKEIANSLVSNRASSNTDIDSTDAMNLANSNAPQKDASKVSVEAAENTQAEINILQATEDEKNLLSDIQQTLASLANSLKLSSKEQALLSDLAALMQQYNQSETSLGQSIDKELSEQLGLAENVIQTGVGDHTLLTQDIEQLISQVLLAQQSSERQQINPTEIEQDQVSIAQIDKSFLAELLADELLTGEHSASELSANELSANELSADELSAYEINGQTKLTDPPPGELSKEAQIKADADNLNHDLNSQAQSLLAESDENILNSRIGISDEDLAPGVDGIEEVDAITDVNQFTELGENTGQGDLESEIILQSELADSQATEPKESIPLTVNSNALSTLAALPENKLDLALRNVAQRLEELSLQSADNAAIQQSATGKSLDTSELTTNVGFQLDFVKSLKQGVEDFKQKIKAGMQSNTDLNTLVTDALNNANSLNKTVEISPQQVEQVLNTFNHTLESGLRLSNALDQISVNSPQNQRLMAREVTQQTQFEQTKQIQQQILGQEKAINITRSEGHQQLVEKVRWMVNQNNLQADIRLDPPDLGSVKVRVNLNGESASVNFVVQSQQAREVLENAAPRLKELLDEQGIELGQSSVQQEQKETSQEQQHFAGGATEPEQSQLPEGNVVEQSIVNGRLGAIDYFV